MPRNVRFDDEPSRPSRRDRDSGIGSSSSEQATRGKGDQAFTAQDRDSQWHNMRALQEALDSANENCERYKKKYQDADQEISSLRKELREKERLIQSRNESIEARNQEIRFLNDEKRKLQNQLAERDEHITILESTTSPVSSDFMMSGGSGDSSNGVRRSKSKSSRDPAKEQKERMKKRLNRESESSPSSTKAQPSRRPSMSHGQSSSGRPTVEMYVDRRHSGSMNMPEPLYPEYVIGSSPRSSRHEAAGTPRTSQTSSVTSRDSWGARPGDYAPTPLPPRPNEPARGRRSS